MSRNDWLAAGFTALGDVLGGIHREREAEKQRAMSRRDRIEDLRMQIELANAKSPDRVVIENRRVNEELPPDFMGPPKPIDQPMAVTKRRQIDVNDDGDKVSFTGRDVEVGARPSAPQLTKATVAGPNVYEQYKREDGSFETRVVPGAAFKPQIKEFKEGGEFVTKESKPDGTWVEIARGPRGMGRQGGGSDWREKADDREARDQRRAARADLAARMRYFDGLKDDEAGEMLTKFGAKNRDQLRKRLMVEVGLEEPPPEKTADDVRAESEAMGKALMADSLGELSSKQTKQAPAIPPKAKSDIAEAKAAIASGQVSQEEAMQVLQTLYPDVDFSGAL